LPGLYAICAQNQHANALLYVILSCVKVLTRQVPSVS